MGRTEQRLPFPDSDLRRLEFLHLKNGFNNNPFSLSGVSYGSDDRVGEQMQPRY